MRYWANLRKLGATAALTAFVAGSAIGASGEEPRRIEPKAAIESAGEHYALLVGVNDYGGTLKTLKYAVSDVERIAGALEKIGFPSDNIRKFVSGAGEAARPSRKRILDALDEMVEKSSPKSTIFVAFSGHGFETVEDGAAAFCPTDAEVEFRGENGDEPCVLRESAILMADVVEKLQKDDANFKMLIVDACREPAATNRASASDGDGKKGGVAARVGAPKENGSKAFAKIDANGLAFLQSCSSQQFSWEDAGLGGGIFTYYFVEGLGGAASTTGDGVTFLEVCGYAQRKTVERTNAEGFWLQRPAWKFKSADGAAESDDFYLVAPKKPKEAAAKLAEAKGLRKSGGLANLRSALKTLDEALGLYRYTDATKEAVRAEREALILDLAAALADEARKKRDAEAFDEAVALAEEARGTFKASLDPTVPKEYDDLAAECGRRRDAWKALDEAEAAFASGDFATATAKVEAASALYEFARGREIKAKLDAESVEAAVLYRRGRAAAFGLGRKLDEKRGFELLSEAAESGSTDAKGALAVLYSDGCAATPPNFDEAFKLAKEASDAGNPWGQYVLGRCCREGLGAEKDATLAETQFKAARVGFEKLAATDALASTYFALCLYKPYGGGVNLKEAARRFREAVDAGLPLAAYWLAACYQYGYGVEKDLNQAFEWYRKGAEAGHGAALSNLGLCYETGRGVEKDLKQAFDWYRKGAEAGNGAAMNGLGDCYY
ncbi:MAG: caspase family protein, partial [Thermoguttaceae bacterium]|nr:caspase family protein [Thermoguttaceae bacterium]